MSFEIKHADSKREPFGEYRYDIYEGGRMVAHYWHDYRGDGHGIEFLDGTTEACPVGLMVEFITGGGPQRLGLSERAVAYLSGKLGR
jgi:hypothetical protein